MDSLPAAPFATDVEPPPQRTFGFRLWAVKHAWTRRLEAVLEPTGLTHMQYIIMRCIGHVAAEGALPSQVRIAETMGIDRMTVSKVVRTLEAKGLLARRPHPDDPRANLVVLTGAGEARMHQAVELALAEQDRFFGRLGPRRQAALGVMLDELLEDI